MRRNVSLTLLGSAFLSVSVVTVLFLISDHLTHRSNSFLRQFPPHPALERDTVDLKYNSYYIAGGTKHHTFLGNYPAPLHMLMVNTITADTQVVKLKVIGIGDEKYWSVRLKVDSPYFYLTDGTVPRIYMGKTNDWTAFRVRFDSAYFVESVSIGKTSQAIRSTNGNTNEYILGKMRLDTSQVALFDGLLQKQIDGRFCTDGMLHYSKDIARLVYIYTYRNQYIVMDSNLNLAYRGQTIDTISRAQIKVASISSTNSLTLASPPLTVNKSSCVSGKLLFIHSGLLAKNESREILDQAAVIDVYDLESTEYRFSFHLVNFNKERMTSFKVFNNKLIALFGHHLIIYDLREQLFGKN